jgi:hypothetical protein
MIGRPLVSRLRMNLMHVCGSAPLRVKQMDTPVYVAYKCPWNSLCPALNWYC